MSSKRVRACCACLMATITVVVAGCSSTPSYNSNISEKQAYSQEGDYIVAALKAAGVVTAPAYDAPNPVVQYCIDGAGHIEQGCVNVARSLTIHGLATTRAAQLTSAIASYWKRSGYGQLSSSRDGMSASAVPPGNAYELSVGMAGSGYQVTASVPALTNDHTFSVNSP